MADKPEVVSKIKNKTFRYGKLNKLIEYYKTGILPEDTAAEKEKEKEKRADNVY